MSAQHHSSPLRYCFRGSPPTSPPPLSSRPNLATSLYQTHSPPLFAALSWSRHLFTRSLYLHLLIDNPHQQQQQQHPVSSSSFSAPPAFTLHIKPFIFWSKHGSKKLNNVDTTIKNGAAYVFWDLSRANFGLGPEPQSGFYVAIVIDGEMALLVGDLVEEAYAKTRARKPPLSSSSQRQSMVLRREHVQYAGNSNKFYRTKANFGGKERELSIDCRVNEDPRLYFFVDNKRVLKIKHLKWKFRGNERIEVDGGVNVQVSWDVYNWLFEDDEQGYALFTFRFEKRQDFYENEDDYFNHMDNSNGTSGLWSQQSFGLGFETKKMKKGILKSGRSSSSSSSFSSASSSCSSVMEWASMEENELKAPSGFSLMVYAWKS